MLVARTGLSPEMVGRDEELQRLLGVLAEACRPEVALVGAEAGLGKTRLIQELVDRVAPGTPVLVGQAEPGSLGRPFALVRDVLEGHVPADRLPGGEAAPTARSGLHDALRDAVEMVRELIGGRRALVVFEDLHWADAESLELFERLAAPDGGPVLLVGTYRPSELSRGHPAAELVVRLERRHTVHHVRLDRLTRADVARFLTAVFGQPAAFRTIDVLHDRTGGNPFFLEELVAASGTVDIDDLCADQPLPWTLEEVVRGQLDGLEEGQRRIVEAAAVLGRRVPFDLLATVARTSEDELIDVLRLLVDRGLVLESEPDVFTFRHALVAEAVSADLLGRERRRLHEAALAALLEGGSDDHAALAHHAAGAGRFDEMVDFARTGARRSFDRGSTYQALQLAELGLTEDPDDLDLLRTATTAAWLVGLLDEAAAHGRRWRDLAAGRGLHADEAAALRRLVRISWDAGDAEGMWAAVADLEGVAERLGPSGDQARSYTRIAQAHMLCAQVDEAEAWADRALAVAAEVGDRRVRPQALVEKGSTLLDVPGRRAEGEELLREAAAAAEAVGDDVSLARALHNLVVWNDMLERDEARALLERMRQAAERAGFDQMATTNYAMRLGDMAVWQADRAGALAAYDRATRARGGGAGHVRHTSLLATELAIEGGRWSEAAALIERDAVALTAGPGRDATLFHGLRVGLAAGQGDVDGAREALTAFLRPDTRLDDPYVISYVPLAIRAGVPPDEVAALVGATFGAPDHPQMRRILDAYLTEARGDVEEAAAAFEGVLADPDLRLPAFLIAELHVSLARTLLSAGRAGDARRHAEQAAAMLERWPGFRRDEADALVRRLGGGDEPDGPASLTPREREVAALLAEGLSNADLAARLYISPKTAAVHVSNILAKLGMSSRAEVAAWAVREGLAIHA